MSTTMVHMEKIQGIQLTNHIIIDKKKPSPSQCNQEPLYQQWKILRTLQESFSQVYMEIDIPTKKK